MIQSCENFNPLDGALRYVNSVDDAITGHTTKADWLDSSQSHISLQKKQIFMCDVCLTIEYNQTAAVGQAAANRLCELASITASRTPTRPIRC